MKRETTMRILLVLFVIGLATVAGFSVRQGSELAEQNELLREQNAIYRDALRCKQTELSPAFQEVWCGKPIE